jgi:hypothetical protein
MKEGLKNFANRHMGATFETTVTKKKKLEAELASVTETLNNVQAFASDRNSSTMGDRAAVAHWENERSKINAKLVELENSTPVSKN